ncbi:hypothetical protein Plhal304r1_c008g0031101 [Plasmopara halstedii]
MTLPRRSLKGSEDHLETPVDEEERVRFADAIELKEAKRVVLNLHLRLREAEMKLENNLREMVPVREHVGTSATPSREGSQILRKKLEDAITKLEQVNFNLVRAKNILTAYKRMEADALKVEKESDIRNERYSKYADYSANEAASRSENVAKHVSGMKEANEAVSRLENSAEYKLKMEEAAEKAIPVSIEKIISRGVVDEIKHLDNNHNPQKIHPHRVDQAIEAAKLEEETHRISASYNRQLLHHADEDEGLFRKIAEIYKSTASVASNLNKSYKHKVKQAKEVKKSFQAEQDAQIKKVKHLTQKLMAAQDSERPQLSSNFGAILPAKSTYATQDPIAAHAAPIIHSDTDIHVEMKLERRRQSDHLDDNRESGVKIRQRIDADPQGL